MRARLLLLAASCALSLVASAAAQEPASRPTTRGRVEKMILKDDVVYLFHAWIVLGDLEVRCETAVLWIAKGETLTESRPGGRGAPRALAMIGEKIKEIYVEGAVHIRQRDEVHECESAFFDFVHERGIIEDPRSRFAIKTPSGAPAKIHIKADELRALSELQSELVGAKISTCPYGNPHYHVASETVQIFRARAGENPPPESGAEPGEPGAETPSFFYTASGNTLYGGSGFPLIWLPDFSGDSASPMGRTTRYIKDVRFGSSSQFGTQVGISLGDDLAKRGGKKWGSYLVDLDYRSKRGPGVGVDFVYEKPTFRGQLKTSYQHDVGTDKIYGKPPTENRYRLSWQNRMFLAREFQLDLEINKFSDEGYYPTYYKGEFENDKPPETYAYLKRAVGSTAFTGLFSARINDWETVTEYRPKFEYLIVTDPITNVFDNPLYFTARAEVSRPRHVEDDDNHVGVVETARIDLDTLLEYPFFFGPVKATPFMGLRTTYYQYDLARDRNQQRNGFTYGGELSMQLSRDYGCSGGFFELDGLRHVLMPSVEFRKTTDVNLHPDELFQYDFVDAFDDQDIVTFEVRNVLQTVRHRKDKKASVDEILDLDLQMAWFPNADRDNFGRPWSNLIGNAVFRVSDPLEFVSQFEWNPSDGDLEVFDVAVGYAPNDKLQTYAGFHHFDHGYDLIYGQASWRVSEKWLLRGYASYDMYRNHWSKQDLVVSRIGHDWVFSAIVRSDFDTDEFSFSVGLEPRFLFDAILRPRGLRSEPEFQYLGSRITK